MRNKMLGKRGKGCDVVSRGLADSSCVSEGSTDSVAMMISAVHGPAWPESRGFGLARAGSGFVKPQAKPKPPLTAWLRLGLAQAAAFVCKFLFIYFTRLQRKFTSTD